jgi:serine/threonine-protein kinase HipA
VPEITRDTRLDDLTLWFLGEPASPRLVGRLHLMAVGNGVSLSYAPSWLQGGFALSEDLPLAATEHLPRSKGVAAGAVDDARPDRWGERLIQFIDKPRRLSLMEYLYYAGDDRYGALGVSTSEQEYRPRLNGPLPRLEDAQALSEAIAKVDARDPINALERRLIAAGASLGGAKPKALIEIDAAQWIIKFFNNEPVDTPLVEHASMTLARQAGITTADTRVIPLLGENALAIRRYDRVAGRRIHCLSAGTALRAAAAPGQEPDLGYPNLAQLLRRAGVTAGGANQRDMRELFRRMVFNILIDNTDDHEKNHALMMVEPGRHGALRLAPGYDMLPANSGQGHQEFGVGLEGRESTLANAMSQCALFGLQPLDAAADVLAVIAVVDRWQEHFRACGVSAADLDSLAQRIDADELLTQRRGFRAADFQPSASKRARHPFR